MKLNYQAAVWLAVLFMSVTLAACGGREDAPQTEPAQPAGGTETAAATQPVTLLPATTRAPSGVTTLSLYVYNRASGLRERSEGFSSTWEKGKDIVSFEAFATDTAAFSLAGTNFKEMWEGFWEPFENYEQCKIGYTVSFELKSGEIIRQTILKPEDVFGYRNYLECYLYDDVNQIQGNWYSHLLPTEVTQETVMTSIKLTAGAEIDQVGGTITLTAFVYSADSDFDSAGEYRGQTRYTVTVKNT